MDSFHKHILLGTDVWEDTKNRIKDAFDRQGLRIKMACMHACLCMCVGGGGGGGGGARHGEW